LLRRLGTTALLVTHDQAEAMALADHLVVMRAGVVVAAGDPRDVYGAPADTELGRFLGEGVVLPGVRELSGEGLVVRCALGCLDVAGPGPGPRANDQGACEVLVRPEQLSVRRSSQPEGLVAAPVGTAGDVVSQSFYGHDALVRVRLRDGEQVSVRVGGAERYRAGDAVTVHVRTPVSTFAD
ncbi:MAG: TOBE domain-containing protein, partial [Mycobacteriaceae bacterium]